MARLLITIILGFWVLMTTLMVRLIYFPEGSEFAQVPPAAVIKMFLEQGASLNTLHIYHGKKKLGHASITSRDLVAGPVRDEKVILASGLLERGSLEMIPGPVAWRLDLHMEDMKKLHATTGQVRLMDSGMVLDFAWIAGQSLPQFTLKKNGQVQATDEMLAPLLPQLLGSAGATPQLPEGVNLPPGSDAASLIKVKSREGIMNLAGQKRRGYVLKISFMERWEIKAFFTEAGELALVDLPEGYRLVEPIIHGLEPDYEDVE